AVMAAEQVGMRREELEHFGEAAGGEAVQAADARSLLEMDGRGKAVRRKHLVCDLKRLLEADRGPEPAPADLQEDLVGDVVVRVAEQRDENLGERTRLPVNINRLEALGDGSGRDLSVDAAARPLDESGDQLARILEAHRRV